MIRKLLDGTQNLESYVDDVLGHTKEWKEHMKVLRDFLKGSEKQIFHLNRVNAGSVSYTHLTLPTILRV